MQTGGNYEAYLSLKAECDRLQRWHDKEALLLKKYLIHAQTDRTVGSRQRYRSRYYSQKDRVEAIGKKLASVERSKKAVYELLTQWAIRLNCRKEEL